MRVFKYAMVVFLLALSLSSCNRERYRTDRRNKLTKHTKKASDYLANQSIDMTQKNIANRKGTDRKARKRLEKQQKDLNEANERTSKVKSPKKHLGNFKFY